MRKKSKRVIPGFGLSLGVTISILSIVVLIPLAALKSFFFIFLSISNFHKAQPG